MLFFGYLTKYPAFNILFVIFNFSVFFKTVFHGGSCKLTTQLATVLLERIVLLYEMQPFASEIRKAIAKQLLLIFQLHPQLVVDQHLELLEFLGNLRTLTTGGEHCYMHLVRSKWTCMTWEEST